MNLYVFCNLATKREHDRCVWKQLRNNLFTTEQLTGTFTWPRLYLIPHTYVPTFPAAKL